MANYGYKTENVINLDDLFFSKDLYDRIGFNEGSLWLWGLNSSGDLGDNTTINRSSPVQIVSNDSWKEIAGGSYPFGGTHCSAIKTNGTLWSWGEGLDGRIGNNTNATDYSSPVQIIGGGSWRHVSCGRDYTIALKSDGTLWSWGNGDYGQLGNDLNLTPNPRSSPVIIGASGTWKTISCGTWHSSAIAANNSLWIWGFNSSGQLGDNTRDARKIPTRVGATNDWKQTSSGGAHTIAVKTDGTLWATGNNFFGQIGDNSVVARSSPVQITGTTWKFVSCSRGNNNLWPVSSFTMAIKTDNTLWGWGNNEYGQLGTNATTSTSSPVQIMSSVKQVSCGNTHALILKTDGTLWGCGRNSSGQLGKGDVVDRSSPVQIGTSTNWSKISTSYSNGIAILRNLSY